MINLYNELMEQIKKAEEEAWIKGIEANAVILNSEFDYVKEFSALIQPNRIRHSHPMIMGKHVFVGKLPKDYSFALVGTNGETYEDELDKYKSIERRIGIRLNVLFSALENGVYIKSKNGNIVFVERVMLDLSEEPCVFYIKETAIDRDGRIQKACVELYFVDYGETWALDEDGFCDNGG